MCKSLTNTILLFFLFCFFLNYLTAQNLNADDLMKMNLEELLNVEIVSASRHEEKIMEAPSAISVITKKDIIYSALHTIPELLQYVVGMDGYTKTYTDMDVGARGFAYDETPKMLVLINAQPVNVTPYSGMQWPTLPITLEEIERIEIVRGPASAIYGADALVGIINIITKDINDRDNKISLMTGERGTNAHDLHYKKIINDDWAIALTASYKQTEKKGDAETEEAKSAAPNFEIKDWAEIYMLSYRIEYKKDDIDFFSIGGYSDGEEGYNPSPGDRTVDHSEKKTFYMSNSYNHKFDDDSLLIRLGVRDLWQENERFANGIYEFKYTVKKALGIDSDILYTLKRIPNNTIIFGTNLSYLKASRDIANTPPYLYDQTDKLWSLFIQDQLKFFDDQLLITASGRYDKWTTLDGVLTPRFALNYSFWNSKANFRIAGGQSFRRPGFDENHYYVSWPGGWFKGWSIPEITENGQKITGRYLEPEKLTAYETGIRLNPDATLFIDIEYFYHKVKDTIGYQVFYSDASSLNLGFASLADKLYVQGIEVEVKKNFTQALSAFLNYTHQKAEIENESGTKSRWKNAPKNKTSAGVQYLSNLVNIDARIRNVSSVAYQEVPTIELDSYTSLDTAVSKSFLDDKLFVKLSLINLLDDKHYEYPIYTQIRRKALLTMKYKF